MYRIKWGFLGCAVLLLTGCAGGSSLSELPEEKSDLKLEALERETDADNGANLNLTVKEVTYGDIVTDYSGRAQLYFPYQESICCENEYAEIIFREFLVEQGSYVKAGDPLVRLSLTVDSIDAEELRLKYERMLENYQRECERWEEEIRQAQEAIETAAAAGSYEQQKAQLMYQQLVSEYGNYQAEEIGAQESLKERLNAYQAAAGQPEIVLEAPRDGYVTDFAWLNTGAQVSSGEQLMCFYDTDVFFYEIENPLELLCYGMEVSMTRDAIADSPTPWDGVMTGKVVCADNVLERMNSGTALIAVETVNGEAVTDSIRAEDLPQTVAATMHPISIKQVLVMPENGVTREKGMLYANIYENGIRKKSYIISPYEANGRYWVLYGVQDGDAYIVK